MESEGGGEARRQVAERLRPELESLGSRGIGEVLAAYLRRRFKDLGQVDLISCGSRKAEEAQLEMRLGRFKIEVSRVWGIRVVAGAPAGELERRQARDIAHSAEFVLTSLAELGRDGGG